MSQLILTAMSFTFSPETLVESLLVMLKGMLGIFLVIAMIWIVVAILNRVTKKS